LEDIGRLAGGAQTVVRNTLGSFERTQAWPDVAIQAGRLYLVSPVSWLRNFGRCPTIFDYFLFSVLKY
jgi:hypothetical protein